MADRVLYSDVTRLAETVSLSIPRLTIVPQRRNGYTALDLYEGTVCLSTLHAGTARECYTYLQGMRRHALLRGDFVAVR